MYVYIKLSILANLRISQVRMRVVTVYTFLNSNS